MKLQRIFVEQVRNLDQVTIEPSDRFNLFYGENASGKTSFLEALHLLAYARSFRSHHLSRVIQYQAPSMAVAGKIINPDKNIISVGIEQRAGRIHMRAAGNALKKTSELARFLPLVIIHQESQQLFSQGPKFRRKFLDWGLFHVEQSFLPAWRRYQRALKQRNACLQKKSGQTACSAWDQELIASASTINQLRVDYCQEFLRLLNHCATQLLDHADAIDIRYQPGWPREKKYAELLVEAYRRDVVLGYTGYGPHRADLRITLGGVPVRDALSRGQQKLLVCAMLISQAMLFIQRRQSPCIILIDDLAAELDEVHRQRVMDLVATLDAQIFVTGTHREVLETNQQSHDQKVFHVEHGRIKEVV